MTRRTAGRIAAAAAIALTLSGCMKVNVDLTMKPDNTVDGTMILAVNKGLAQLAGQDPKVLADEMNKQILNGGDSPKHARTEAYSDDTFVGTKITFQDEPINTFNSDTNSTTASPTDGTSSDDALKIVRDGDDFVVTGVMDTTSATSAAGDSGVDMSAFTASMQMLIAITFPGEVKQHNGTLKGRTVTWTPRIGERVELNARGSAIDSSRTIPVLLLAVGGALALGLVGLLLFLLLSRRRRGARAVGPEVAATDVATIESSTVTYLPEPSATFEPATQAAPPVAPPAPPVAPPVAPPAPPVEGPDVG